MPTPLTLALLTCLPLCATAQDAVAPDEAPMLPTPAVRRAGIPNFAAKCLPGAELTVAYFGASVTNGAGASSEDKCWRRLVHSWLERAYPETTFRHQHVVNGGTGSQLGACRVGREVLDHKPALVFVEFSVNDWGADPDTVAPAMEGILRQVRRADPTCDVIMVHTINNCGPDQYRTAKLPQVTEAFERLAERYGVPSINVGYVAAREIIEARMTWEQFSIDTVHPTDAGYAIYADAITRCLDEWRLGAEPRPHELPEPAFASNWEDARLLAPTDCALTPGWRAETADWAGWFPHFPSILTANAPREGLRFRFRGTHLGLYHAIGPDAGTIEVLVDGVSVMTRDLWDQWCTYPRSAYHQLASSLPAGDHLVEIRLLPDAAGERSPGALHMGFVCLKGEPLPLD